MLFFGKKILSKGRCGFGGETILPKSKGGLFAAGDSTTKILLLCDKIQKSTLQIALKVVQSSVIYCVSEYTDGT